MLEGDDDDEPIVIDNVNDAIAQLAALEDTGGIAEGAANVDDADGPPGQVADDPVAECADHAAKGPALDHPGDQPDDPVAEPAEDAAEGAAVGRLGDQPASDPVAERAANVGEGAAPPHHGAVGAAKKSPRQRRSHELLFKLRCIAKLEAGTSKRKILKEHSLDKKTVRFWVAQKQDLLKMAHDVVQHGTRIKGRCRLASCGFKTKYNALDESILKWWRSTKTEQNQQVFRPRLQREIEKQAAHLGVPHGFNAADWTERFLKRHRIGDMAEKGRETKSPDQLKQQVQKFHNFCHSVCATRVLNVAPQDTYNLDEVPNSVFGFLRRNVCSLNDRGTPNEVCKSPFTDQDFMRSKTDLPTIKFQAKDEPVCQPIKPFIMYEMKDNFKPSGAEKAKYSKDVIVTFQKVGVIDIDWMLRNYLPNWGCAHQQRRFAICDSATAHITQAVKDCFTRANTSVAVIRGGLTAILQSLDCDFILYTAIIISVWLMSGLVRTQISSSLLRTAAFWAPISHVLPTNMLSQL